VVGEKNIKKKYIQLNKTEILKKAKALFSKKTIEKVTMEEIALKAGVGVATVYRYFGTKKRIAIEVGILFWQEIKKETDKVFLSEKYLASDGIGRINIILDMYSELYYNHRAFLLFLDDFDTFCVSAHIKKEELKDYQNSIADFYVPYSEAVKKGSTDGTIKNIADERLLYLTVNHAMLSFLRKMARGEILAQDAEYESELALIKKIILSYFKA